MADLGRQIGEAFVALNGGVDEPDVCPSCGGDGWYVGHEDACYDTGACNCSGIQIQCDCRDQDAR